MERTITLGLQFQVDTVVRRLSPLGSAALVEVPLLPGESVTTDGVRVEGGKALVTLAPDDRAAAWSSALAAPDAKGLALIAGKPAAGAAAFVEEWRLAAGPMWHVTTAGPPPLHDATPREDGARAWRPWPGETLTVAIARPAGVPGQTLTIDASSLAVHPGLRSTDATLTITIRASRGGQHPIGLPAGAELLSATVNGTKQPLRADGAKLMVPIVPGTQTVALDVRLPTGIAARYATPRFDLGVHSVNAEVVVDVPGDRWVLFATGPRAGPAVLFWSFLVVICLCAFGLSRVPFSPIKVGAWIGLGLGLTQVPVPAAAFVAGWLLLLGARKRFPELSPRWFNLRQVLIAGTTLGALGVLLVSIQAGLLGAPDMQIEGNGSTGYQLRWFLDQVDGPLPVGRVLSAPTLAFRLCMLAWSLWLALALIGWLKDGFAAFSTGGMWRKAPPPPAKPVHVETPAGAPTSATGPSTKGGG